MIDISIVWHKIKLVFSFLKFPKWIAKKIGFYHKCYKFKKLPKDKQDFLFLVFECDNYYMLYEVEIGRRHYGLNERFWENNKDLLKIMKIDGFLDINKEDCYHRVSDDEVFDFEGRHCCITQQYLPIIQKYWMKKNKKHLKTTKFNYKTDDDDIPF